MSDTSGRTWIYRGRSWVGITAVASHYYASVECKDDEDAPHFEVTRTLSAAEARALNTPEPAGYKEGDKTNRFDSRGACDARAVELWQEIAEPGDVLYKFPEWLARSDDGTPMATAPARLQSPEGSQTPDTPRFP